MGLREVKSGCCGFLGCVSSNLCNCWSVAYLEAFADGYSEEVSSSSKHVAVKMPLKISAGDFEIRKFPSLSME